MTDYTAEIAAAMSQGMSAEDRRRQVASERPGYGAAVQLPDNPVGLAVGKAGLLDVVGEGHSVVAEISPAVSKSFGAARPQYADDLIGGPGYGPGDIQSALRALGERVFAAQDAAGRADVTVVSLLARPSLLARLFGRLRRH